MLNRNALHALMGLEATPIKAGGFKYIHRDTGMVFEIAPATPDSAGQHHDYMCGPWTAVPHSTTPVQQGNVAFPTWAHY